MTRSKLRNMKGLMIAVFSVFILTQTAYSQICGKAADIAFVIDSSSSIHPTNFGKQIEFVKRLVPLYNIGYQATVVSAITFSDRVEQEYSFSDEQTEKAILKKVGGIKQVAGQQTWTHKALKFMREELFSTKQNARPRVPKICILLTDGASTFPTDTLNEAQLTKDADIQIIAIGIGDKINATELKLIVSPPVDKNFIKASTFADMDSAYFQELVTKQSCDLIDTTSAPITTTPAQKNPDISCHGKEADMVFIVDQSSSIWNKHFKTQLRFLKDLVSHFDINNGQTKVAMITFSDWSEVVFYLDDYTSTAEISAAISSLKQYGGLTNTHLALRMMLNDVLTKKHGYRPGVAHICILITDGVSRLPHETTAAARSAHAQGVYVFAIGVGNETDVGELKRVASGPDYVLDVQDGYDALYKIEDLLAFKACEVPDEEDSKPPNCK